MTALQHCAPVPAGILIDFAGTMFEPVSPEDWVASAFRRLGRTISAMDLAVLAPRFERAGRPGGRPPAHVPPQLARLYAERDLNPEQHRRAYTGLLEQLDGPPALATALYEEAVEPRAWVPARRLHEALGLLVARNVRVAVVSNVAWNIRSVFKEHGLVELIDKFILSHEHGLVKPDESIFALACTALNLRADGVVMIGDDPLADGGAVRAGITTVLLPRVAPGKDNSLLAVLRCVTGVQAD